MIKKFIFLVAIVGLGWLAYGQLSKQNINIMTVIEGYLPEPQSLPEFLNTDTGKNISQKLPDFRPEIIEKNYIKDKLTQAERSLTTSVNQRLEQEIADLAARYNDNLSNVEARKELEAEFKNRAGEYKSAALKLAKDQIARDREAQ